MKRPRKVYIFQFVISLLVGALLAYLLLPSAYFMNAIPVVLIPLIIIAFGFRRITKIRIQGIRKQLYQILHTLEEFDVDEPQKVEFEESPFPIFNDLNEYLVELIERIRLNYQSHKQFTQNASHELQTPLAIIKGNIELLLQSPNIGEKEIKALGILMKNTNRLSKLNSTLILLSKIEHQRFGDSKLIKFSGLIDEVLGNFDDSIDIQGLQINKDYESEFKIEMSETLAEILVANLLQNAIRHNVEKGVINININEEGISISNPGVELDVAPEVLFKRFKRKSDVEESLGLGLSIVQRICEQSNLKANYLHSGNMHTLEIKK